MNIKISILLELEALAWALSLDISIIRNAWGRQICSFTEIINIKLQNISKFKATFIRAPKISRISKSIQILSKLKDEIILVTDGIHLASSFHPEFGTDSKIHKYFIQLVKKNEKNITVKN